MNEDQADSVTFGPFQLFPRQRKLLADGATVRLGSRAFEILVLLVERAGEVVGRDEIYAHVWPGLFVDENNLRVNMVGLRKALGDGHGGTTYVTNIPGRGYCFVAPVSRSNKPRLSPSSFQSVDRPNNLPVRLTRMVGRDETVHAITDQLLTWRFVTVVGPGGMGKTTVAVAVAEALLLSFESSVYFMDFSPLKDPSLLSSTLLSAFGLSAQSDSPIANIVSFLRDKKTLIVLDCCEHLIDAIAPLAEQIFREAPQVYILATSRESLRVEGEHVHRLIPLESPPEGMAVNAAEASAFPAVQLFLERATASLYEYELRDADAPVVAEICRKLDGIALAIELAAGRVDAYGIKGIAGLLDNQFRLLRQGRRTALPRHQTLSATLDWSYDLLTDTERMALRRLSAFVGTFTLEAALAVASGGIDTAEAVDAIANLVAKSLVVAEIGETTTRYRLLDTTRAYAGQKLLESDEVSLCARRHAAYYCNSLERAEVQAASLSASDDFAADPRDLGNIRAALEWVFGPKGDAANAVRLAAVASTLFLELSLQPECRAWTERAIALAERLAQGSRQEMLLQMSLGISILYTIGSNDRSHQALMRALALAEQLDDPYYQLHTLEALSVFHQRLADMRVVRTIAERGEAVIGVLAERTGWTHTNWMMASAQQLTGNQASACEYAEVAVRNSSAGRRFRRFSMDRRNNAMITLARALWMLGYPDRAVVAAGDVLAYARSLDHTLLLCIALQWMTSVALWTGNLDMAAELIGTLLDRADKYSLPSFRARGLGWKGALSLRLGHTDDAIRLLRSSMDAMDTVRDYQLKTPFLSELADALADAGRPAEALAVIDEAIACIDRTGEDMHLPEVLRKKGNLLASGTAPLLADTHFLQSLEWARKQSSLSWELRTATSCARFWRDQGRGAEARLLLAPVYARFTEGFETADLQAAKHLLDELP